MLWIIPLYLAGLASLGKFIYNKSKSFTQPQINENDNLYNHFINYCQDNDITKDSQSILVCCTGDKQSMTLLNLCINYFDCKNIHVINVSEYRNNNILFIHDICDINNLKFHYYQDKDHNRYKYIDIICKKYDIHSVFEAHTFNDKTNNMLDNIFSNNSSHKLKENNIHYPFNNIYINEINNYVEMYNIPIDTTFEHENNKTKENKYIFNNLDNMLYATYPDWREHLDNFISEQDNKNNMLGEYGFIYNLTNDYNIDRDKLDKLCDKYNCNYIDNNELINIYQSDSSYVTFINKELYNKQKDFINFLLNQNPENFFNNLEKLYESNQLDEYYIEKYNSDDEEEDLEEDLENEDLEDEEDEGFDEDDEYLDDEEEEEEEEEEDEEDEEDEEEEEEDEEEEDEEDEEEDNIKLDELYNNQYENLSICKSFHNKLEDCDDNDVNNIIYSVDITTNKYIFTRSLLKDVSSLYANDLINGKINFSISNDKKTFIIYYLDNIVNE